MNIILVVLLLPSDKYMAPHKDRETIPRRITRNMTRREASSLLVSFSLRRIFPSYTCAFVFVF